MFFESLAEFLYVCVAAVNVTRDVIDGSTSVSFKCFIFIIIIIITSYAPISSKIKLSGATKPRG